MDSRIDCDSCGLEERPIGSAGFADWWENHWAACGGVVFDRVTVANLQAMRHDEPAL